MSGFIELGLRPIMGMILWLVVAIATSATAQAHETRPSIAVLSFAKGQAFTLNIEVNAEALVADIGTQHDDTEDAPTARIYNDLRKLPSWALEQRLRGFLPQWLPDLKLSFGDVDGEVANPVALTLDAIEIPDVGDTDFARETVLRLSGSVPQDAAAFVWSFPERTGESVLRVERSGQDVQARFFRAGQVSEPILVGVLVPQSWWQAAWDYIVIGYVHILPKGLDHILFVLGLFFLSTRLAPLLWQVTAFTIAHSVTLALGLYGVVSISPAIVEPLIALSIVYVAVENLMTERLQVWRTTLVFAFGLLHGFGFAGILAESGIPRSDFVLGLVSFNIGVELGQLTVIALAWLVLRWFMRKPWYRRTITIPASMLIALVGAYWFVERTLLS